jgi:hypothetical protein
VLATAACSDAPGGSGSAATTASLAPAGDVAAPSVPGSPGDRAAMQQIVSELDAAWTAGDHVRYAAFYAGAEWVGPDGSVLTAPAAITARYRFVFNVLFPNSTKACRSAS